MTYEIWQAPIEEDFVFMPYVVTTCTVADFSKNWCTHYEKVYEGDHFALEGEEDSVILEELFYKFNRDHPDDYRARSLSVSDIVVLGDKAYYCDSFGWKKVI